MHIETNLMAYWTTVTLLPSQSPVVLMDSCCAVVIKIVVNIVTPSTSNKSTNKTILESIIVYFISTHLHNYVYTNWLYTDTLSYINTCICWMWYRVAVCDVISFVLRQAYFQMANYILFVWLQKEVHLISSSLTSPGLIIGLLYY